MISIVYNADCNASGISLLDRRADALYSKLPKEFFKFDKTNDSLTLADLLLAHSEEMANGIFAKETIGPWLNMAYEQEIPEHQVVDVQKSLFKTASHTYLVGLKALEYGFSYFLGGGMHHARSSVAHGFCLFNDIAIAILKLKKTCWVIDVDAHFGDGTAEIFANNNDVHTYSIHMKKGWPFINCQYPVVEMGDMCIGVESSQDYLPLLKKSLQEFALKYPKPHLVYIVHGADPYEKDELPSAKLLALTRSQMLERSLFIYQFFHERNIPQAYVMSGGYGDAVLDTYVDFLIELVGQNAPYRSEISARRVVE